MRERGRRARFRHSNCSCNSLVEFDEGAREACSFSARALAESGRDASRRGAGPRSRPLAETRAPGPPCTRAGAGQGSVPAGSSGRACKSLRGREQRRGTSRDRSRCALHCAWRVSESLPRRGCRGGGAGRGGGGGSRRESSVGRLRTALGEEALKRIEPIKIKARKRGGGGNEEKARRGI